jgi:membrane glycosyltransferase
VRRLAGHTLVGLAWAIGVYAVAPDFFWWLTPLWLGLILAVPLAVWSSRSSLGLALKRIGLFVTPEETQPPPELSRLRQALRSQPNLEGLVPTATATALVPAEAGFAMPHLQWPQGKPALVQEVQCSMPDAS